VFFELISIFLNNAIKNRIVKTNIIVGAGALSIKKLKYVPKNIENTQIKTDMISILENCLVSRKAIAPGAIIKPTAKIKPVAERVITTVTEIIESNK
jgi:hypothetical protein